MMSIKFLARYRIQITIAEVREPARVGKPVEHIYVAGMECDITFRLLEILLCHREGIDQDSHVHRVLTSGTMTIISQLSRILTTHVRETFK